jgi:imidazolonepropionase-like amidohydrolase
MALVPERQHDRLHLTGTLLPAGESVDLWVVDGLLRDEPVAGATTITVGESGRGWILPGLVDAHCHVGLDSGGAVDRATAEAQARADRDAGVLLIRDAGSPSDTRWVDDRPDLPRIVRAGRHIARPKRYLRYFADEIEPAELITAVERQAAAGDGWVKLVGDWIDRDLGDLAPLWPVDLARAAIARAHELGVRVTAHVFGEQATEELIHAGVDGIEHGTGLTDELIAIMAERQISLVPTMIQVGLFERFAAQGEAKFPAYAKHMRALQSRHRATMAAAWDAGVPIYAGTDAGGYQPHGLIGTEIARMADFCGAEGALGAGSWRARTWLGHADRPVPGSRAELVIYPADPRQDLSVLTGPRHIIAGGTHVFVDG